MDEFIGLGQVEKRDPNAHPTDPRGVLRTHNNGLTKREHFASMAMQGILSNAGTTGGEGFAELLAAESIKIANALIQELEVRKK